MNGKLKFGACAVLLDALDEVKGGDGDDPDEPRTRPWLRTHIETFAKSHSQLRLMLASRIADYAGSPIPAAAELELIALDSPQIEALATAWFGAALARPFLSQLRQSPQAAGLSRIPLLLTLLCATYEDQPGAFPTSRAGLYECCVRGLVFKWRRVRTKRATKPEAYEPKRNRLVQACFALHEKAREQFTRTEFLYACGFDLMLKAQADEATALADDLLEDGLLAQVTLAEDPTLMFLHRTFHEYFAAQGLASRLPNLTDETLCWWDYLNLTHWTEPLVLASQMLDSYEQAMRLVRLALQVDAMLGARLADSVRAEWQDEAVGMVRNIKGYDDYRIMLLGMSQSTATAADFLKGNLSNVLLSELGKLGQTAAIPELLGAMSRGLADPVMWVRAIMADAVGRLGEAAATPAIMDTLARGLSDPDRDVRQCMAEAVSVSTLKSGENRLNILTTVDKNQSLYAL